MSEHSPFMEMCRMWDVKTALKQAEKIGLMVTEEELTEARRREQQESDIWNSIIESFSKKEEQ